MILLWGLSEDGPLKAVRCALEKRAVPTFFLDQKAVLDTKLDLLACETVNGFVQVGSQIIRLESITSAYIRPYNFIRLAEVQAVTLDQVRVYADVNEALQCWAELTPALVVNRPSAMSSNCSKPYQLMCIRSSGFEIPDTIITTSIDAVLDFWNRHGEIVYKSISGVRSIVSRLRPNHLERLHDIANCPTQFQQYVDGIDYRVHVVGDQVFSSKIICSADDYRYAARKGVEVEIRPVEIPLHVADRCRSLAKALFLPVAGVDLRQNSAGKWYCFEVNPSPAFTFYENATGQPIGESVADLLVSAVGQNHVITSGI